MAPEPKPRQVCRACFDTTGALIDIIPKPWPEGGGGDWVCESQSAHLAGSWADGGTLDLGIIRAGSDGS